MFSYSLSNLRAATHKNQSTHQLPLSELDRLTETDAVNPTEDRHGTGSNLELIEKKKMDANDAREVSRLWKVHRTLHEMCRDRVSFIYSRWFSEDGRESVSLVCWEGNSVAEA